MLDAGSTFDVAAALGTQTRIEFLGGGSLVIDIFGSFGTNVGTSSYAGPKLLDFAGGDTIDLRNFAAASAQLAYDASTGILRIANGSQSTSLAFQNASLGSGGFRVTDDGVGGIFVTHS